MIRLPCKACGLHAFRRNVVEGRGSIPARLLFIADAPGSSEDLTGRALIGADGKLLECLISDAGIKCSYYVVHCCGCRPCDSKVSFNREPQPHEVLACMPRVQAAVALVKPERIVLLGKTAVKYYGKEYKKALRLIHPAILLRSGGKASPYYSNALRSLTIYMGDLCQ